MIPRTANARNLWDRYLQTRSNECREALVRYYTPSVQRQTTLWAYGLEGTLARIGNHTYDGLARGEDDSFFLPFVPPAGPFVSQDEFVFQDESERSAKST